MKKQAYLVQMQHPASDKFYVVFVDPKTIETFHEVKKAIRKMLYGDPDWSAGCDFNCHPLNHTADDDGLVTEALYLTSKVTVSVAVGTRPS